MKLFDLFKKKEVKREEVTEMETPKNLFDTDFMRGISFEENPLEGEIPDDVRFFDKDGNEVHLS